VASRAGAPTHPQFGVTKGSLYPSLSFSDKYGGFVDEFLNEGITIVFVEEITGESLEAVHDGFKVHVFVGPNVDCP
jgi:hypothetical protein